MIKYQNREVVITKILQSTTILNDPLVQVRSRQNPDWQREAFTYELQATGGIQEINIEVQRNHKKGGDRHGQLGI
jgi:hypothetical protein